MFGQTSLAPPALGLCLRLFCARKANADGAAPGIESIKDVVLAEIDLHRPASNPLRVVPHEVGVDALAGDSSTECPARPSCGHARRKVRRFGSGGRRSCGRGRLRSRGSNSSVSISGRLAPLTAVCSSPTPFSTLQRQIRVDVLDEIHFWRDDRRQSARRDADRILAELVAHPPHEALDQPDVPVEQTGLAWRRPWSGQSPRTASARRYAAAARRAETARRRKSACPEQITPPRYSPFAEIASNVVAVPKSTTIIGAPRSRPYRSKCGDAVREADRRRPRRGSCRGSACPCRPCCRH